MQITTPEKAKTYLKGLLQGSKSFDDLEAMELCIRYHDGTRKDGVTPEWFHQISIALYLLTIEGVSDIWTDLVVVAFLHDIAEDYRYPISDIRIKWGEEVAAAVELLSKQTAERPDKKDNAEYYKAMSQNRLASIVKGADRIHNIQTMPGVFTPEKQRKYITEAREHIIPMLKVARSRFPRHRPAYENIKFVLTLECTLIENTLVAMSTP